jgi:hypothetical protein
MERQLELNLATAEERVRSVAEYLRPVQLASRQVAAVALIVGYGELIQVRGQRAARWQASKDEIQDAGRKNGLVASANTFLRAVEELESERLVGVLRNTRPWTYAVNLVALARLEAPPADPLAALEALPAFGGEVERDEMDPVDRVDRTEFRSTSVNVGQSARSRVSQEQENPCLPCTVSRDRETGDRGLVDRMRRPWDLQRGLTDADLVAAVRKGELDPIRRLWRDALVLEWIGCSQKASDDEMARFLACVHHAATAEGLHRRMGNLVARVKRGCDLKGTRQASDDWAAAVMRKRVPGLEVQT